MSRFRRLLSAQCPPTYDSPPSFRVTSHSISLPFHCSNKVQTSSMIKYWLRKNPWLAQLSSFAGIYDPCTPRYLGFFEMLHPVKTSSLAKKHLDLVELWPTLRPMRLVVTLLLLTFGLRLAAGATSGGTLCLSVAQAGEICHSDERSEGCGQSSGPPEVDDRHSDCCIDVWVSPNVSISAGSDSPKRIVVLDDLFQFTFGHPAQYVEKTFRGVANCSPRFGARVFVCRISPRF